MTNLQGAWQGGAVPNEDYIDRYYYSSPSFRHDKYADSLLSYYYKDSTTLDLKLRFKDSTCWIDGLNFYHRRVFSIVSFDVLNGEKNLLVLETPSNRQDSVLITQLFSEPPEMDEEPPEMDESDTFSIPIEDSTKTATESTFTVYWGFEGSAAEATFIHSPKQALMFQNIQLDGDRMTCLVHSQHSTASTKVEFTRVK